MDKKIRNVNLNLGLIHSGVNINDQLQTTKRNQYLQTFKLQQVLGNTYL